MTTPLKGLLRIPTSRRQTSCSWLFTKYHQGQIHSVVRVGDSNPDLPHSNFQL